MLLKNAPTIAKTINMTKLYSIFSFLNSRDCVPSIIIGSSIVVINIIAIDKPSAFNENEILGLLIQSMLKFAPAAPYLRHNATEKIAAATPNNIATLEANLFPDK